MQKLVLGLSAEAALRLELGDELNEYQEMAAISIIATCLAFIWFRRTKKKNVALYEIRAEMESLISILRRSRHSNAAIIINDRLEF